MSEDKKTNPENKPKKSRLRRFITGFAWLGLSLCFVAVAAAAGFYNYYAQGLPGDADLKKWASAYSTEIPNVVKTAFIAVKDAHFFQRGNIGLKNTIMASWLRFTKKGLVHYPPPLIQQVIKVFMVKPEAYHVRIIQEAILALRIENHLTKEEILNIYLSSIYLGENANGVEAAALTYFDKPLQQLNIAEAALLASLSGTPDRSNPIKNPSRARERQLYCIKRMNDAGFITEAEAAAAKHATIKLRDKTARLKDFPLPETN